MRKHSLNLSAISLLVFYFLAPWMNRGSAAPKIEQKEADSTPHSALGAKALGLLHSGMVSQESDVRVLAAEQWGPIGNPTVLPMLKRALKDENLYVRVAASGSLYQLGDLSGVSVLEEIVQKAPQAPKEGDLLSAFEEMRYIARNKVRVAAIRTLGLMGRPSSIGVLKQAKKDPDGLIRDAAAIALARLGSSEDLLRFVEALESEDPLMREQAVKALGEIATTAAMTYLKAFAKDTSSQVRAAVMEGLGATGNVAALPELSEAIRDQNELVRSKAVAALGRIGSPSAGRFLKEALDSATNVYMQLLATAGLVRSGEKVDLMPAQRALSQPDVDTRLLAVEVLETTGGEKAIELLGFALEDKEMRVRTRAAAALVRLLQKKAR